MPINDLQKLNKTSEETSFSRWSLRDLLKLIFLKIVRFNVGNAKLISPFLLLGFMGAIFGFAFVRPSVSWDMIAYTASALKPDFSSAEALHGHVYELIKASVDADFFAELTQSDEYRLRQYNDASAFYSMLPMYDIKWLYVQILALLGPVFGYLKAGLVINILSAGILFSAIWMWLSKRQLLPYTFALLGLFLAIGIPDIMVHAGPDFPTLTLVASAILLLDIAYVRRGVFLLIMSVLMRPDSVVLLGALMFFCWVFKAQNLKSFIVGFCLAVAAYIFVVYTADHVGWWSHFWFSAYKIQNTLVGFEPDFSIKIYLISFFWNIARSVMENNWFGLYLIGLAGGAYLLLREAPMEKIRAVLISAMVAALALKFVIFPLHAGRTHMPILLPMLMLIAYSLWQFRQNEKLHK